jgi:RHS repeat-associated protein
MTPPLACHLSAASAHPSISTGKERDAESGNDYFGARYYASSMGRWLSPDWSAKYEPVPYAKLDNPQTLNLYSYVLNNPLTHFDPDGHACDSLWHCAQGFLNVIEVKASVSLGFQASGQWGVAHGEVHATIAGAEGTTGLGGGNKDLKVTSGIGASGSASGGPAKASGDVHADATLSAKDGANASLGAGGKVALGPASASASASLDKNGAHTTVGPEAGKSIDTDFKVGGSLTGGYGLGASINFSQLGRAFGDVGDSLNALGSNLMDHYITPAMNGEPSVPEIQKPF